MSKKGDKKSTAINRTTSETLRLGGEGDSVLRVSGSVGGAGQGPRKKIQTSSSSFQITGVSLTRMDFGDDSADDLDESHTDDISRVTDNETPSFSEDSRDIDEQGGGGGDAALAAAASVCVPRHPPVEHVGPMSRPEPPDDGPEPRFKVVKVPNAAPYGRGRWTCFDYLDTARNQPYTFADGKFINQEPSLAAAPPLPAPPAAILDGSSALFYVDAFLPDLLANRGALEPTLRVAEAIANIPLPPPPPAPAGLPHYYLNYSSPRPIILDDAIEIPQERVNSTERPNSDITDALTSTLAASHSGSAPNNNNIDRKIEEALDAVKTHLMVAVHKEVDFLKTRVSTLEGRVNELEIENSILRVNYLLFKS